MIPTLPKPKRLHVTGGRGRLAPLIADHFRAPTYETVLYSRDGSTGLHELNELLNADDLTTNDVIVHLAWSTLPATSEKSPGTEQRNDLPFLEKLLAAIVARPTAARPHFIFFSSGGAVYGNAPGRHNREGDDCHPIGHYGRAKLAAEQIITAVSSSQDLPCSILRISNPYGYPVPSRRLQGIVPHAIRAAVEGSPLQLWGNGQARKDFIYYTDFLSALQEITDRRLTGIFNVCSGESHSIREIITLVEKHTRRSIHVTSTAAPVWDVQDSRLHHQRLTEATGWQPQVNLDEGIRRSIAGFLDH